jgi:protein phosphatase
MAEPPLHERVACLSEPGRRRVNQDAVLVASLPGGAELIAVADGMGGLSAGEVASSRALEVLRDSLVAGQDLTSAVRLANLEVYQQACANPEFEGMGTTLVGLLRQRDEYLVANVGDSRAYRIDESGIQQLTEDHSFLAEALRSGRISAEEARNSPWRNAITRALGTEAELEVDCFGPFNAHEPHAVVLCTDGIYRVLSDDELYKMILSSAQLDDAVRTLAAAAYDAGSNDNISVALVWFGPRPLALAADR